MQFLVLAVHLVGRETIPERMFLLSSLFYFFFFRFQKAVRPDEKETNLTAALCRLTTLMPIVHCEEYRRESIQEGPSPWNELYPADILSLVYQTADEVLIRV